MTLNEPLIKDLKGYVLRLHQDAVKMPITDTHPSVLPFCQLLESIFRKGLKGLATAVGVTRQDYWVWIQNLPKNSQLSSGQRESSPPFLRSVSEKAFSLFKSTIEMTQKCSKVRTVQGRGRYFIRVALVKNIITVPVHLLHQNKDIRHKTYDSHTSILADEILTEVLLSALQEVTELNFDLNVKNASFLDETWLLPIYQSYEFVPCYSLGIKIGYVRGRAIAVNVREGSVAAEDDKVEVGDILDEMYGESLYLCKKWKIPDLLKHRRGMPIQLDIVKGHYTSGELYPPAASVLRQLGVNLENLIQIYRKKSFPKKKVNNQEDVINPFPDAMSALQMPDQLLPKNNVIFPVLFIGKVYLGKDGTKEKIIYGISECLRETSTKQKVILETQETALLVKDPETRVVLYEHSYTMIGACGRPKSPQTYFAYTLGETSCNLSQHFNCYVYQTKDADSSRDILQNI
uniref:RUN domain-containing protein n=1 Tax=Strigamia maritima TaxID=126957 RepID=T1IN51_STRMM